MDRDEHRASIEHLPQLEATARVRSRQKAAVEEEKLSLGCASVGSMTQHEKGDPEAQQEEADVPLGINVHVRIPAAPGHSFRRHLGTDSGLTWALIPEHLGTDSGDLGTHSGAPGHSFRGT
ncbi:MAG: hypothetical protein ABIP39_15560 [Polyangiaceae bacterium]